METRRELNNDEYHELQALLALDPETGDLLKQSSGLPSSSTIVFFYAFTKGNMDNISQAQLKALRDAVAIIRKAYG